MFCQSYEYLNMNSLKKGTRGISCLNNSYFSRTCIGQAFNKNSFDEKKPLPSKTVITKCFKIDYFFCCSDR